MKFRIIENNGKYYPQIQMASGLWEMFPDDEQHEKLEKRGIELHMVKQGSYHAFDTMRKAVIFIEQAAVLMPAEERFSIKYEAELFADANALHVERCDL